MEHERPWCSCKTEAGGTSDATQLLFDTRYLRWRVRLERAPPRSSRQPFYLRRPPGRVFFRSLSTDGPWPLRRLLFIAPASVERRQPTTALILSAFLVPSRIQQTSAWASLCPDPSALGPFPAHTPFPRCPVTLQIRDWLPSNPSWTQYIWCFAWVMMQQPWWV